MSARNCIQQYKNKQKSTKQFNGWETDEDKFNVEFDKLVKSMRADEFVREVSAKVVSRNKHTIPYCQKQKYGA